MVLNAREIEAEAATLYRLAGHSLERQAQPHRLARAILGRDAVKLAPVELPYDGALVTVRGQPRIYLMQRLTPARARFVVLHELAHWHLRRLGLNSEANADALAAALLVPRSAFARSVAVRGSRPHRLAREFVCTESCAALRVGEVTGQPTALSIPGRPLRTRGAPISWPPQALSGKLPPGVVRTRLRDEPSRLMLMARAPLWGGATG